MVPSPGSAPCGAHRRRDRHPQRRAVRPRVRGALGGAIALFGVATNLIVAPPAASQDGGKITWKSAFLVALESRRVVHTDRVAVVGRTSLELFLVVEGERGGGLPVYCTAAPTLRIAGRAVPKRMISTPERAGLNGAEIRWQALRATDDLTGWSRRRLDSADHRWSMEMQQFPGRGERDRNVAGTVRFAAAISTPGPDSRRIETSGWSAPAGPILPDEAPGFPVTRYTGRSLMGRAEGFALLPVLPDLPASFARNKIALSPADLVVTAYEDLGEVIFEDLRDEPLDSPAWEWLFETILPRVPRRTVPGAALVGPDSRGIRWGPDVQLGDVLLVGDQPVFLQGDDGDGWLGEGDRVLATVTGRVEAATLSDIPGDVRVLRPRLFMPWRERLKDAGYGDTGQISWYTADLAQAFREFQRDQGLPETGYPDPATADALDALLAAMDSASDAAAGER